MLLTLRMLVLLGVLCVPVAAAAEPWAPPTGGEWAVVGVAAGLTVVDFLQTSDCLYHPRPVPNVQPGTPVPARCQEMNPLLGKYPGRARLWGTVAGELAVMAGVFYVLPPKWRVILPAAVSAVEVGLIIHSASNGLSFAFHF